MSERLLHFFFSDTAVGFDEEPAEGEPKLVWKAVLRTGTWKLRPGPGGVKIKAPLKVYRDEAPKGHISMSDLVTSFKDGAKENVTATVVHADGTTADVGHIRKLVIQDVAGEDGSKQKQALLWAGMEITEPDILGKIERKTLVGCSGGILFDYQRTSDAKKFGQILSHVMVTNNPWIDGTGGYTDKLPAGVMAAERSDLPVGELEMMSVTLDDAVPDPETDPGKKDQPSSGSVVWKPEEGYQQIRGRVQKALDEWRRALLANATIDGYRTDFPYYYVDDIAGDGEARKALVRCGYGSDMDAWVVSVKLGDDGVEVEPFMNWTPAKQEWVAASQDQNHLPEPQRGDRPAIPASGLSKPIGLGMSDLSGLSLAEARAVRAERRLGQPGPTNGGTSMGLMDTLKGVELSDEQREAVEAEDRQREQEQQELARRRASDREEGTKTYLSELAIKLGYEPPEGETDPALSLDPALARYVRSVLMSDDGGPAIQLSEITDNGSRTTPVDKTASDIIKGFIEALPKGEDGKISLAQQARRMPGDVPPPGEPPNKPPNTGDETDPKAKADAFLEEARGHGLPVPVAAANNGGNT